MKRAPNRWLPVFRGLSLLVLGGVWAIACGGPQELGAFGSVCFRADDCQDGLACVPSAKGSAKRVCSTDLSGIVSMVDGAPPDSGTPTSDAAAAGAAGTAGTAGAPATGGSGGAAGKAGASAGGAGGKPATGGATGLAGSGTAGKSSGGAPAGGAPAGGAPAGGAGNAGAGSSGAPSAGSGTGGSGGSPPIDAGDG